MHEDWILLTVCTFFTHKYYDNINILSHGGSKVLCGWFGHVTSQLKLMNGLKPKTSADLTSFGFSMSSMGSTVIVGAPLKLSLPVCCTGLKMVFSAIPSV